MADLTPFEKAFKNRYLKDFNGTKTYLELRPHVTPGTARAEAPRILAKPSVQEAISEELNKRSVKDAHNKQTLLSDAFRIGNLAENDKKLQTALNSVDLRAKINGIYREQETDLTSYTSIMQQIIVNVNSSGSDKDEESRQIDGEIVDEDDTVNNPDNKTVECKGDTVSECAITEKDTVKHL